MTEATGVIGFLCSGILGLTVGSFLSMLIPRLHNEIPGIVKGRSECPCCHHILSPLDLFPLLSYVFLGGRCRYCKKAIAIWYPLTELSTALLFMGAYYVNSPLENGFSAFLWLLPSLATLIFIFFYDLRYKEIHDAVMAPAIVWAFISSMALGHLETSLWGAGLGLIFFGTQYLLSKGRWLGSGDLRIGAFIGLLLGFQGTLIALFISYIVGSLIGVFLLMTHRASAKTALPLGPFLVVGTLISLFWGEPLIQLYTSQLL